MDKVWANFKAELSSAALHVSEIILNIAVGADITTEYTSCTCFLNPGTCWCKFTKKLFYQIWQFLDAARF